ncbi:MAG: hypothetical protein ILNGONEN_02430 [Syntrophorhabdaceae bacterium]|nr:hypothetical protein [Syntrophorhabdaceae bacterium]
MDWLTFFSNLTSSLAWPATIIIVVFCFKEHLVEFLKNQKLSRLKWKDAEIIFTETMTALTQETKEVSRPATYKVEKVQEAAKHLGKSASISPKAAILEAFSILENAAVKAGRLSPGTPQEHREIVGIIQPLIGHPLMGNHVRQILDLSRLRNKVAHTDKFELSGYLVQEYIDMCLSIADLLLDHDKASRRLDSAPDSDNELSQ